MKKRLDYHNRAHAPLGVWLIVVVVGNRLRVDGRSIGGRWWVACGSIGNRLGSRLWIDCMRVDWGSIGNQLGVDLGSIGTRLGVDWGSIRKKCFDASQAAAKIESFENKCPKRNFGKVTPFVCFFRFG